MDFEQTPKTILDQWRADYSSIDGCFRLAFRTGNDVQTYLVRPQAAKAISAWLVKAVRAYEDAAGSIDMSDYDGGIPSPMSL